jgi:hypothetical protein
VKVGPFRRLYRLRPLTAALLCLPGLLLCAWYGWKAFSSFDTYRRFADPERELTLDAFHLAMHDEVTRDLRRMTMPAAPKRSRLERFAFHVSSDGLDELYGDRSPDQLRPYVAAELETDSKLQPVEIRLRGSRHWNVLGEQRSLKVRLPPGDLYDGHRIFNLINDPDPMVVGEELILDLAREQGVLTPRSAFARVRINGADLGVMHFETQPDEGLLRLRRRMPGSIYSSNLPGSAKTDELWSGTEHWRKPAWREEAEQRTTADLERFLERLGQATVREFAEFARAEIDLEAFAAHEALDVIFGGDQHDFRDNHKLYFDPYRGRIEPVAWQFSGYKHEEQFDLVENPILLRLKQVPEYLSLRGRTLHDLLVGDGRVAAVKRRGRKALRRLAPELAADRNFDAYHLLPRVDRFHRRMVRPMDMERAVMVLFSELKTYAKRHAFLLKELQRNPLWLARGGTRTEPDPTDETGEATRHVTSFELIVDGQAGAVLEELSVEFDAECEDRSFEARVGGRPVAGSMLHPRVALVPRDNPGKAEGKVRALPAPARYPLELISACELESVEAWGTHLATGSRIRSRPAFGSLLERLPESALDPDDVPRFVAGETAPDPHRLWPPAAQEVQLGPGEVEIATTRVFGPEQTVEVAPGTRLAMGAGASLVFQGPVRFAGTAAAPIVIEGAGPDDWGGIAVQGMATAGSSFDHVIVRGGTVPAWRAIPYPGAVDVHHTEQIAFRNCRFGRNSGGHDMLHAVYVDDLVVEDCEFEDTSGDAVDLEFVAGVLRRVSFLRSGDDALDLMGSEVDLVDSVAVGCGGYGVSAGEETEAAVRDTLLAGCKAGVLAKNASSVALSGTLLYRNKIGVRLYQRTVRYAGESRIDADALYAVECDRTGKTDDESAELLFLGRVERRVPRDGSLDHLLQDVLGLSDPDQVERFVAERRKGGQR